MSQNLIVALLVAGAVLVAGSFVLRAATGGRYEVKPTDLVWLVVPLLVAGLATGRLQGIDLFGVKTDLSAFWQEAAQAGVGDTVADTTAATVDDVVEALEVHSKGGVQEIPRLLEQGVGALEFRFGGSYYGPAIRRYFDALSGSSQLQVVVVGDGEGRLFGVYVAPDLIAALRVAGEEGYTHFERLLRSGSAAARDELARLPGFIGAEQAVVAGTSKREALARMETLGVDLLPVADGDGRFAGTVGRSRLTASMILAVTAKIEGR